MTQHFPPIYQWRSSTFPWGRCSWSILKVSPNKDRLYSWCLVKKKNTAAKNNGHFHADFVSPFKRYSWGGNSKRKTFERFATGKCPRRWLASTVAVVVKLGWQRNKNHVTFCLLQEYSQYTEQKKTSTVLHHVDLEWVRTIPQCTYIPYDDSIYIYNIHFPYFYMPLPHSSLQKKNNSQPTNEPTNLQRGMACPCSTTTQWRTKGGAGRCGCGVGGGEFTGPKKGAPNWPVFLFFFPVFWELFCCFLFGWRQSFFLVCVWWFFFSGIVCWNIYCVKYSKKVWKQNNSRTPTSPKICFPFCRGGETFSACSYFLEGLQP